MTLPTVVPAPSPGFPKVLIKHKPDDFAVEELPLYEPSGQGTHSWFWIEKRNMNTLDAVRRLAAVLKVRSPDAGVGGLKDAKSIARQWISFEHLAPPAIEQALAISDTNLRVLKVSRHGNKLKMGHLRGNRFIIRLRTASGAAPSDSSLIYERAKMALQTLATMGIPNYYGSQRFGRSGVNVPLGEMLVRGDTGGFDKLYYANNSGSRRPDRKLRNLYVNAFQSELFNRVAALRMPEIGRIQAGDLAFLHRNGAVFKVPNAEDAAREQFRADTFEISPSGPIFGAKSLLPEGIPGEIEQSVLAAAQIKLSDFGRPEAENQPGARRSLRVGFLETAGAEQDAEGVVLRFALPSGSYATIVIREIIGDDSGASLSE